MRRIIILGLVLLTQATVWAAAPPVPWRNLTAQEQMEITALQACVNRHVAAGEFEAAAKVVQQIAAYRRQRQGASHWQATAANVDVEIWHRLMAVPVKDRAEVMRATTLNGQGAALVNQGRYREAEQSLRQALDICVKLLGEMHSDTARSYVNVATALDQQGKHAEALQLTRKALAINQKVLGEWNPATAVCYMNLAVCLNGQGKHAEALPHYRQALAINQKVLGEWHPATAVCYMNLAVCLNGQGKHAEALPLHRQALATFRKVLGERHPDTAVCYMNLAGCLNSQGKEGEALPLFRQALDICLKVLGEWHPTTATSYTAVANCLDKQGKSAETLPLFRKTLAINQKVLGEMHPHTAGSYNVVAGCLEKQGKHAEALPLHCQALAIRTKVLGELHPSTATSYNNLAHCLDSQGKVDEALPLYRQALATFLKVLGEMHPETAACYNNLAFCLESQGKVDEALALRRQALAICQKVLGEFHRHTARCYTNLARCLDSQGKHAEAMPLHRQALAICTKVLGEVHPDTANSYCSVAACLHKQGKYAEALPLCRQALAICQKVLGELHPHTAACYNNLARCLWEQQEYAEAARLWQQSLPGQEIARWHSASTGFERAQGGAMFVSPHAALTVALARQGQPANAFRHVEASLARALLDDLSAPSEEQAGRVRHLQASLSALDPILVSLGRREQLSDQQRVRYTEARREYDRGSRQLSELLAEFSTCQLLPLERIQRSIPEDAALVLWIDVGCMNECWGCVVRRTGKPRWEALKGSGKDGQWTADDTTRGVRLYQALRDPTSAVGDRTKLLSAFARQRLDPLKHYLSGVKRLFVVPTGIMAYVPAELLDESYAIRYVPSGSMLARLSEHHRAVDGSSLLAVGDPTFDKAPPAEAPSQGVLVKSVLPGSHAFRAGLQAGDVLLRVGDVMLETFDGLDRALASLPAGVTFWREGKTLAGRIQGSPLGAVFDERSARAAARAWRKEREAMSLRSTGHKQLPGTRLEVESIAAQVKGSTTLLHSDASEQRLDELIDQDRLKAFKILHLATHGAVDERSPERSALILAQDWLPDPLAQVNQGKHVYDGRLTVARIRARWRLDADLVVLSACDTGLGQETQGDGLLGFAQAFLSRGARSVVLSRWKVDDAATALLMVRFYENLLGKRQGLKQPLGRADALDEAKRWLRSLPRKQAGELVARLAGGKLRGSIDDPLPEVKTPATLPEGDQPFAHPFYWAAFTLIGDPD